MEPAILCQRGSPAQPRGPWPASDALESHGSAVFYLYVTAPGMPAQKVLLDRPVITIGRSSMNDLPISDKMLSRQHARIVRDGNGGLAIQGLGPPNPTFFDPR